MWRYKLIKATRRLRILLGGYKGMEEKHKLFQLPNEYLDAKFIGYTLSGHRYYYDVASTTYKRQIYTVRKLIDLDHQIHLRFYSDGWVSGHYELRPDAHLLEHLDGVELRDLNDGERKEIRRILAYL